MCRHCTDGHPDAEPGPWMKDVMSYRPLVRQLSEEPLSPVDVQLSFHRQDMTHAWHPSPVV